MCVFKIKIPTQKWGKNSWKLVTWQKSTISKGRVIGNEWEKFEKWCKASNKWWTNVHNEAGQKHPTLITENLRLLIFSSSDLASSDTHIFTWPEELLSGKYWYKRKTWKGKMIRNMLTRRRESETYMATVSRHRWSRQISGSVFLLSWWRPQC